MGQATITAGGPEGSYTIGLDFGQAAKAAKLAEITAYLAQLVAQIATAQASYDTQKAAEEVVKTGVTDRLNNYVTATQTLANAVEAENAALENFRAVAANPLSTDIQKLLSQTQLTAAVAARTAAKNAIDPALNAYTKAAQELTQARYKTANLMVPLQRLKDDQAGRLKDASYWAGIATEESRQAWCADFTEDASGDVATIEIPGESKIILIAPGAPASAPEDGRLRAREVQSPAQVFFNAAILPGWQKFKPTYRRGVITAINEDADTASVTLTDDTSSANGLGINQTSTLAGVPVQYMECHARAFEVGDLCVIKFMNQDWAQPKVVGFAENPKPCPYTLNYVYPNSQIVVPTGHEQKVRRGDDADPVEAIPVYHNGAGYEEEWYQWDDGVTDRVRTDTNVQQSKTYVARYLTFKPLFLLTRNIVPEFPPYTVGYNITQSGYTSNSLEQGGFATLVAAQAWRFPEFTVTRTVFGRLFTIIYTYNAGTDRYEATSSDK